MLWTILGVIVIIAFVVWDLLKKAAKKGSAAAGDQLYQKQKTLVSAAERSFLGVLDTAVGGDYRVFAKVRVADVISPRRGLSASKRQTAFNRIQSKHLDFVLCDRDTLSVICAVELNDKSHRQSRRRRRDEFLSQALESVGLPLVAFAARRQYAIQEVRAQIDEALGNTPSRPKHNGAGSTYGPDSCNEGSDNAGADHQS